MDKVDFKKLNKELYARKTEPSIIKVPAMNFIMVDGRGNPNIIGGEYEKAVGILYALSYHIKMSRKGIEAEDSYDYVVPPLEGLWWLEDSSDRNFAQKDKFCWTSMIRQPEFVTEDIFNQAIIEVAKKKPDIDVSKARLETFEEGQCVQCMHIGTYNQEDSTIAKIDSYITNNKLTNAIGTAMTDGRIRHHHEIYLSDPRKSDPLKMQTILRHPVI